MKGLHQALENSQDDEMDQDGYNKDEALEKKRDSNMGPSNSGSTAIDRYLCTSGGPSLVLPLLNLQVFSTQSDSSFLDLYVFLPCLLFRQ